jgi:hypothetical protein
MLLFNFDLKFGKNIKNKVGRVNLALQNLYYFEKYSKNKNYQFFPKKNYISKKRTFQLFGTTFYFSLPH